MEEKYIISRSLECVSVLQKIDFRTRSHLSHTMFRAKNLGSQMLRLQKASLPAKNMGSRMLFRTQSFAPHPAGFVKFPIEKVEAWVEKLDVGVSKDEPLQDQLETAIEKQCRFLKDRNLGDSYADVLLFKYRKGFLKFMCDILEESYPNDPDIQHFIKYLSGAEGFLSEYIDNYEIPEIGGDSELFAECYELMRKEAKKGIDPFGFSLMYAQRVIGQIYFNWGVFKALSKDGSLDEFKKLFETNSGVL